MASIFGTNAKNKLKGAALADSIFGLGNDDRLYGLAGNDKLYGGKGNDKLYGGKGNDTLDGGKGNDLLDGGLGKDKMKGGAGNDTYIVDNAGDTVTDSAGVDTVNASVTHTIGAGIENLNLTGTANIDGTGNALDNTITGNAGRNQIDGGLGADHMSGGAGDDLYDVDNVGDVVTEVAGGGTDTVLTTLNTYTLGANLEYLAFFGTGNFTGVGNSLDNVIIGGSGNDTLAGGGGHDTFAGGDGTDTVDYSAAAAGVILLNGFHPITPFPVGPGQVVVIDTYSSIENITGTTNELANTITGGAGIDTVDYSTSASAVYVDLFNNISSAPGVVGAAGDHWASIESVVGSAFGDLLIGRAGGTVSGGAGDDFLDAVNGSGEQTTLIGGLGSDQLTGIDASGRVNFVLELAAAAASGADTITRFTALGSANDDKLYVNSADFGGITTINNANSATDHNATAAAGIGQFIYQQDTLQLWFDGDGMGAGAAVLLATFSSGNFFNSLAGSDFVII